MDFVSILLAYLALIVFMTLHELGHLPSEIRFRFAFYIIPNAYAYQAMSRLGGLIVNVAIFVAAYFLKPEMIFIQYVALFAWIHFILYAVLGSILPETKSKSKSAILDDVPNEYGFFFIIAALAAFILFGKYYLGILGGFL